MNLYKRNLVSALCDIYLLSISITIMSYIICNDFAEYAGLQGKRYLNQTLIHAVECCSHTALRCSLELAQRHYIDRTLLMQHLYVEKQQIKPL